MDTRSHLDPVERIYDARTRGVCLIGTAAGARMHLHAGCWVTPVAGAPPRVLVAFPKEFEGADLARRGGAFSVSLPARDQKDLNAALFAGRHSLDALGRERFLRAPSGCPVLRDGVGYLDCQADEFVDLGDFLLAVGDLRAAATLHPEKEALTVNEIQQEARSDARAVLPLAAFEDDGAGLAPAPVDGADAGALLAVHGHRPWGRFLVSAAWEGRAHLHVNAWAIQCSHEPPRLLVCIDRRSPAADLVGASGRFALSLLATDQWSLAETLQARAATPQTLEALAALAGTLGVYLRQVGGLPVLEDAVAHFVCRSEGTFGSGANHVGFYGPVVACDWGRHPADHPPG